MKQISTYNRRSAFRNAMNSIQFNPNAMMFENVTDTTMNLMVSTAPHNLSKYRKHGGTTISDTINCSVISAKSDARRRRAVTHFNNTSLYEHRREERPRVKDARPGYEYEIGCRETAAALPSKPEIKQGGDSRGCCKETRYRRN